MVIWEEIILLDLPLTKHALAAVFLFAVDADILLRLTSFALFKKASGVFKRC